MLIPTWNSHDRRQQMEQERRVVIKYQTPHVLSATARTWAQTVIFNWSWTKIAEPITGSDSGSCPFPQESRGPAG